MTQHNKMKQIKANLMIFDRIKNLLFICLALEPTEKAQEQGVEQGGEGAAAEGAQATGLGGALLGRWDEPDLTDTPVLWVCHLPHKRATGSGQLSKLLAQSTSSTGTPSQPCPPSRLRPRDHIGREFGTLMLWLPGRLVAKR